jgi:hypothetical protein
MPLGMTLGLISGDKIKALLMKSNGMVKLKVLPLPTAEVHDTVPP